MPLSQACSSPRRLCGQLYFGIPLELLDAAAHVVEFGLAQVLTSNIEKSTRTLFLLNVPLNLLHESRHAGVKLFVVHLDIEHICQKLIDLQMLAFGFFHEI